MNERITLTLNGTERTFDDLGQKPSLAALVTALGFRADRVALEHNGAIVPRTEWLSTVVEEGDKIELVHFVGGGQDVS